MTIKSIVAGATAISVALATAAPAFAGEKNSRHYRGNDRYSYDYGSRGYYDNHGRWRAEDRYGYNRSYGYGSYGRGSYGRGYHRDDNGTALGIGLGVVGLALVLGAMSSGKNKQRDERTERRDDRYDKDGWYRGDSPRSDDGRWNNPDDGWASGSGSQTAYSQFSRNDCVQTREYQTRVTVGGRNREAYGTSCLLGNGQWLQGPPILVPDER
jgi:surface antigen